MSKKSLSAALTLFARLLISLPCCWAPLAVVAWASTPIAGAATAKAKPAPAAPMPVAAPHFPDRLHAYVWRNWPLVPSARLAEAVGATPDQITALGKAMGLPEPPAISDDQWRRSYITIIRRNWHLLSQEQLGRLLGWSAEQLAFTLREDDFLAIKLGPKPRCKPLAWAPPGAAAQAREREMLKIVRESFPDLADPPADPLFGFVRQLSAPLAAEAAPAVGKSRFSPRFCYSYFALYGDPLLEPEADPFPEGYLARLAASGVDGVWLQGVLYKLTPFPWEPGLSEHYQERLARLRELVARARRHGIGVYLYFNEPRAMPLTFYEKHPQLKGTVEGDHAALCTSAPGVREYLRGGAAAICRAVPDLAGIFTITASENLTNCWSHGNGKGCPRCAGFAPEEKIADVNAALAEGIAESGAHSRLIAWDWGWRDTWAPAAIARLPKSVALMSVSEWSLPIERGGVASRVGEYSISAVGPGPRATSHWAAARARGLTTLAKIQANNTWELSVVPYIPAVANVARHAAGLREAGVDGLMLSWTLGGYPSPNLDVVAELGRDQAVSAEEALGRVARRRFGEAVAPAVVAAWQACSAAFSEFPYSGGVLYRGPQQLGPANLLWERPTGFKSTMTGIPYDDLDGWRDIYPVATFIKQMTAMTDGFDGAGAGLRRAAGGVRLDAELDAERAAERVAALRGELDVIDACAIILRSVANQGRFVQARRELEGAKNRAEAGAACDVLSRVLENEIELACRLYAIQRRDSRIGFEAANHYFFVPQDLVEKVINCQDLLTRWLPAARVRLVTMEK